MVNAGKVRVPAWYLRHVARTSPPEAVQLRPCVLYYCFFPKVSVLQVSVNGVIAQELSVNGKIATDHRDTKGGGFQ